MADVLDQQDVDETTTDTDQLHYDASRQMVGMQFIPTVSADISKAIFKLSKIGTPTGNVWCEVWSDSGDSPNAQIGVDSATVDVSGLGAAAEVTLTFSTKPTTTSGGKYWLLLDGDFAQDASNGVGIQLDADSTYTDGLYKTYNGTAWSAYSTSYDCYFKEYYDDTTIAVAGTAVLDCTSKIW